MIEVGTIGGAREVDVPTQRGLPATLPVLPLRETVVFPETLVPLAVGQERSMALINDALGGDRMIAMVASRNPELEAPGPEDLYGVGVAGVVARMLKVPDGTLRILVQATQRIRVTRWEGAEPYLVAVVEEAPDLNTTETPELLALVRNVQGTFANIVEQVAYLPEELHVAVANLDDPSALSHLIAGALRLKAEQKQTLLEERDVATRLRRLSEMLARELEVVAIGSKIQSQVQSELDKSQREYFLRQQLKAIQDELGEGEKPEAQELRGRVAAAALPENVLAVANREIDRLERMTPASPEYQMIRTYLDWILDVPWSTTSEDRLD
ncbi:MAG: LON peptidase substrate-binding domain-containing protein, partial [Conexibacter sp.]